MTRQKYIEGFLAGRGADRLLWGDVASFGYAPSPVTRIMRHIEVRTREENGVTITETVAPSGTLVSRFRGVHPVSHPVRTVRDVRVLCEIERDTTVTIDPSLVRDYHPVLDRISVNPSPVQRLLQLDMGLENFYGLWADDPALIRKLFAVMMVNYEEECRLISALPVRSVRMVENTSTTMISPNLYKELSIPQAARASRIFHSGGKVVIAHMCGLLKHLLGLFPETGIDGIHSCTPPPVGDIAFEMAWEAMGDSFRVEGRLGTTCWLGRSVEQIRDYLRPLISAERIRKSPFILEIHTDGMTGIPEVDWQRVREAVGEWEI